MPSVIIVDDSSAFRAAARALLEADGWDVIGEAADAVSALVTLTRLGPDVALLDVGTDGFGLSAALAELTLRPRVVLCSSRPSSAFRDRLVNAPVAGFLAKDALTGASLGAVAGMGDHEA